MKIFLFITLNCRFQQTARGNGGDIQKVSPPSFYIGSIINVGVKTSTFIIEPLKGILCRRTGGLQSENDTTFLQNGAAMPKRQAAEYSELFARIGIYFFTSYFNI